MHDICEDLRSKQKDCGHKVVSLPPKRIFKAKLERQVFDTVAVVVYVNLVQRLAVQWEIVRTAVGSLNRNVVRNNRYVVFPARFIALEQVEVRAVRLRILGYKGRLAMA